MLRELTTTSFWANDLDAAKKWYSTLLGIAPSFHQPGYLKYRFGDYMHELGIVDRKYAPESAPSEPGSAAVYWHVDDVSAALNRLLDLGATEHEAPTDRGDGYITASAIDPFGNILGIMYNPNHLEIYRPLRRAA